MSTETVNAMLVLGGQVLLAILGYGPPRSSLVYCGDEFIVFAPTEPADESLSGLPIGHCNVGAMFITSLGKYSHADSPRLRRRLFAYKLVAKPELPEPFAWARTSDLPPGSELFRIVDAWLNEDNRS